MKHCDEIKQKNTCSISHHLQSATYIYMVDSKLGMYSMLQKKMLQDAHEVFDLQMPSCREEYHKVFVILVTKP